MQFRSWFSTAAALTVCFTVCSVFNRVCAIGPEEITGKALESFRLTDTQGREWTQADFSEQKLTVVAFLGTQCPLAKLYSNRLVELEKKYREKGVGFIAVDSNVQDSLAEMSVHAKKFEFPFPFVKDPDQGLADRLGATRTPEVCVIDAQGRLRYRGRIDDQFGIGYTRENPTSQELVDAIDAVLDSREVINFSIPASGCLIGRPKVHAEKEVSNTSISYADRVARILQDRCVACHRDGDIGPMDLSNYHDASAWADMIVEVTQDRRMPPWHASPGIGEFSNDSRLSDDELETLRAWAGSGTPRGNPDNDPKPLEFAEGWLLPRTPDLIVPMRDRPFSVAAKGEVKYQYFVADPKLEKDIWVSGMEIVPGNRGVVHHILVFARDKKTKQDLGGERSFLVGYVPGTRAHMMEAGYAKRIPANSQLIFQVHYTPNGTKQTDLSKVGFILADPETITHEVMTTSCVEPRFRIPPGDSECKVEAMLPEKLPACELLSLSPHMHLRGKSFRYTLVSPQGERTTLLDIPKYDFNWQTEYQLKQKMPIAEGSKMYCEAAFDNSTNNPNNPDPKAWVTWGDQTYEEMMIGYFHYAVKR